MVDSGASDHIVPRDWAPRIPLRRGPSRSFWSLQGKPFKHYGQKEAHLRLQGTEGPVNMLIHVQ
eukprot:4556104-Alexandrium_andersonii.AAC.1